MAVASAVRVCKKCGLTDRGRGPRGGKLVFTRLASGVMLCSNCRDGGNAWGSEEHRALRRDIWVDRYGEPYWTRERVIERLRQWAERRGRPPRAQEWGRPRRSNRKPWDSRRDRPSPLTVRNLFGSWNAALEAAGLEAWRHPLNERCPCGRDYDIVRSVPGRPGWAHKECRACQIRRRREAVIRAKEALAKAGRCCKFCGGAIPLEFSVNRERCGSDECRRAAKRANEAKRQQNRNRKAA